MNKFLLLTALSTFALKAVYHCPAPVYSDLTQTQLSALVRNNLLRPGADPRVGELIVTPRSPLHHGGERYYTVGWVSILGPQNQDAPGLTRVEVDPEISKDVGNVALYSFHELYYVVDPEHNLCGTAEEFANRAAHVEPGMITVNVHFDGCGGGRHIQVSRGTPPTTIASYLLGEGRGTAVWLIPQDATLGLESSQGERRHGREEGYEIHSVLSLANLHLHADDTINIYANCDRDILTLNNPADINP